MRQYIFVPGKIAAVLLFLAALTGSFLGMGMEVRADRPLVIVIDPGHGGGNLGARYDGYVEKDMTLITARAMRDELQKYDNVEVYLTRDEDTDLSIEKRADIARDRNADFLFCLHYNSSEAHTWFGAEVWVPAEGEYYARGYSFAQLEMQELTDLGLYSRGIKTKLNESDENYYGILRYCTEKGIASALIEHCHLDHDKDKVFYQQNEEQLIRFGKADANAVARYFGLRSEILGVDYSNDPVPETAIPKKLVRPDKTEPELCRIEITDVNEDTGELQVRMEAEDQDSYILYYAYSIDGGESFSMPDGWPRPESFHQSLKEYSFTVEVPFDEEIRLCARAYNGFDLKAESNEIVLDPIPDPQRLKEEERIRREAALRKAQESYREIQLDPLPGEHDQENRTGQLLPAAAVAAGILICIFLVSYFMARVLFRLQRGKTRKSDTSKGNRRR